jgi:hypothetical protein
VRLAALLLAVLAPWACGSRAAAPPPVEPAPPEPVEPLDRAAAAEELRVGVLDSYRMLSAGYDNVYLDTLARDEQLVLIGVGPGDRLVGFDARAAAMRDIFGGEGYQLVSKDLRVGVAADGCCAWTQDDLSYRAVRGGRRAFFPLRSTGYYERRDGRWLKLLEHVSYDAPVETLRAMAEPVELELAPVLPEGEAGRLAREAVLAAAARGEPRLPGLTVEVGALRLQLAPGGNVVWAAALVRLRGERGDAGGRGTWILERAPTGELQPVLSHVSIPVEDGALLESAFGEAGPPPPR